MNIPKMPVIKEEEYNPLILEIVEVVRYQSEMIQILKDEIAELKGDKKKPKIKSSNLDKKGGKNSKNDKSENDKRAGSKKNSKKDKLIIHETIKCSPDNIPEGSVFKGHKEFIVQGIVISPCNTLYQIERWLTPDGHYINGELPDVIKGHFSPTLISYIQYQYYHCRVTQPLLLEQLHEFGIDISAGQINNILIEGNAPFHKEKDDILDAGLKSSSYINVDDTGARHQGKNGYCTHIGNKFFAWFSSTQSKSRINFMTLLQAGNIGYVLNSDAFDYMKEQRLSQSNLFLLKNSQIKSFADKNEWGNYLRDLGFERKHQIQIATEGALLGHLFEKGLNRNLAIISDDAGQFNILLHALCWVHAERLIHKLIPHTDEQRVILKDILDRIWKLYANLNQYREKPTLEQKKKLEEEFDNIFNKETKYLQLNIALKRLYKNKYELLLVLDRPDLPLHNNLSESDIREYVQRRKMSGGTRSENGRKSRDTFVSLKKTARKIGVSFWQYLNDRNSGAGLIPQLGNLVFQRSFSNTT